MPYPKQADTCAYCPTPMPRRKNGRRPRCSSCSRKLKLALRYGITLKQYEDLLEAQGGVCKLCYRPETRAFRGVIPPLSVDHDHATGRIRGLLCYDCNHMLGLAHDDIEVLTRAVEYLRSTTKKK